MVVLRYTVSNALVIMRNTASTEDVTKCVKVVIMFATPWYANGTFALTSPVVLIISTDNKYHHTYGVYT